MGEIDGKVAVVTGAASGLGYGLSVCLLRAGARVVMADIERDALDNAVASLGATDRARPVLVDVSLRSDVETLRIETEAAFGPAHLLFNNAGVQPPSSALHDTPASAWEWTLGVNLMGVVHGVSVFLGGMLERGEGHIVNTGSLLGLDPGARGAPYSVSKTGVATLSMSLRRQLADTPVRVSVVFPHVRSNIGTSRRNWPQRLGPDPWSEGQPGHALLQPDTSPGYVEAGMDPVAIGALVLDAVQAGRVWISLALRTTPCAKPFPVAGRSSSRACDRPDPRVRVIGLGTAAAELAAARHLREGANDVTVPEARDRVGVPSSAHAS